MSQNQFSSEELAVENSYPLDWSCIAWNIKTEAGWCCEHCGHPHDIPSGYMLTVHHLDMNKGNCAYENLVALCQRCHLRIQARYHPNQMWLWLRPTWVTVRKYGQEKFDVESYSTR